MSRTQYFAELDSVRQDLIGMGQTTLSLFDEALLGFTDPAAKPSSKAGELEAQTDHQHRAIHDKCLNLITRQAPVARDARLVTGILDAIVDLELIADYCYEMATLSGSLERRPPSQIVAHLADIAGQIRSVVQAAIGQWDGGKLDYPARSLETAIKADCDALYRKLSRLMPGPGDAAMYVDLMMVCRHLERILRHAMCVAEQALSAAPLERANPA